MVSKVFCTSSSLETSQLRAIWSSRRRCRMSERITHLKRFSFAKSENEIMTMELCSSRAKSLF